VAHHLGELLGEVHHLGVIDIESREVSHFGYVGCGNGAT
jgi:hypothetical protein